MDIVDVLNVMLLLEVFESFSIVVYVSVVMGDNLEYLEYVIVRTVSGGEVDVEGGAWVVN